MFAKGIACFLLLWHHLFYTHPEYGQCVQATAQLAKVCVAVFVMLSGYGLSASSSKLNPLDFYRIRLSKIYIGYWCVFAVFVPISWVFFGRGLYKVFNGHEWIKFFFQLAGLHMYYGGFGFNPTWWFMSAIIPLYVFFPLLERMARSTLGAILLMALSCILLFVGLYFSIWVLPFAIGILAEKHNGFIRASAAMEKVGWGFSFPIYIMAGVFIAWIRRYYWNLIGVRIDSLFGFWIILGCAIAYPVMRRIRSERILAFVGTHSMNIFLFHTFLYYYFFPDFFYGFKYPFLIFAALLGTSLATSAALEWCKRIFGIPRLERFIRGCDCDRIKRQSSKPK